MDVSPRYPLFYEGPYDALRRCIMASGKAHKEIALLMYPGRRIETATSLLSRALSPENLDVHLSQENIQVILDNTDPTDYIYYLCDLYGMQRPKKKTRESFEDTIRAQVDTMVSLGERILQELNDRASVK